MPSVSSGNVCWTPPTPSGDERKHPHVLASIPITPPGTTPRPSRALPADVEHVLKEHAAHLMDRMEALMSQQEQVIVRLFESQRQPRSHLERLGTASATAVVADTGIMKGQSASQQTPDSSRGPPTLPSLNGDDKSLGMSAFTRKYDRPGNKHPSISGISGQLGQLSNAVVTSEMCKVWSDHGNLRDKLKHLVNSVPYELVMTSLIILNTALIVEQTDQDAKCDNKVTCAVSWINYMNLALLVVYTIESAIVIYAWHWGVLGEPSRVFEILIVITGYLDILVTNLLAREAPSFQIMRLVRLTRLLRGMRLLAIFPELKFITVGFLNAMRVMMWGCIMLMLIILAASIVAVELVHPVNEEIEHDSEYCKDAFGSVWNATIWFFQVTTAGDSWGACAIPIIKYKPLCFFGFAGAHVTVQIGFLNLIMSVIIDRVADARAKDTDTRLHAKEKEIEESRQKWFELFDKLDKDGNGQLSVEEIVKGFDTFHDFNKDLKLLGIERDDLPRLLSLMDEDNDGSVSVDELVSMFDMVVHFDNKMHQVSMGMQLRVIGQRLEMRLKRLQNWLLANVATFD